MHVPRSPARAAVAAAFIVAFTSAAAHDYWIERDAAGYALLQGHVHSSHQGEERVAYDPAIVKRVACLLPAGELAVSAPTRSYPVRIEGRCAAVLAQTDSGYWTQTLGGTVNRPRSEVRGALRGWRAQEIVKRLDAWTPAAARPLLDSLELTPLDDPFAAKPGDKLRILATWRGQPRRGVAVAYDGDLRGATGGDGLVNIRIRHGGVQVLSASWDEAAADPNADKIVHGAILQFELAR